MSRSTTVTAMLVVLAALLLAATFALGRGQQAGTADDGRGRNGHDHAAHEHSAGPGREGAANEATAPRKDCGPDARVYSVTTDPSFNAADEVALIRRSYNAFVGRVVDKVRDVPPFELETDLPSTEFAIEVQENVKGSLSGTVTVSQGGGCDLLYGGVTLINNNPLLEPGQEALFTTTEDAPGGPHSLTSHRFSKVIVETEAEEARVVAKFREAKERAAPMPKIER